MSDFVMLNNVQHIDLKVLNRYFAEAGDNKAAVLTFPTEFVDIQREYPILLSKNKESGLFQAVAILGIQKDENLFLADPTTGGDIGYGWNAYYVPAIVARGPFMLGIQGEQDGSAGTEAEALVYVNPKSPKLSSEQGVRVFQTHGGNSPYLDYIIKVLNVIQEGAKVSEDMFANFDRLGLIEPLAINIDLKNGDKHTFSGYFTISEERLAELSGDDLEVLNTKGYLQGAFLMLSSLSNFQRLIEIKNSRL